MAIAVLAIGGRRYEMTCREGEQAHFETLAALIDAKAAQAARAVGGLTETRLLLLAALLLADDLHDLRSIGTAAPAKDAPAEDAPASSMAGVSGAIEALALRVEALAAQLEKTAGPS